MAYGITVKPGQEGTRVEIQCPHQNGLLYTVRGEASWVCSEELLHAHALAGFLNDLVKLSNPMVGALMQRWGLYHRERPLEESGHDGSEHPPVGDG